MKAAIGKSGTGIGKSGTGIGKSGTGICLAGTRCAAFIGLVSMVPLAVAAQTLQVSTHDDAVLLSLHDQGRIISGQATIDDAGIGYLAIPLTGVSPTKFSFNERCSRDRAMWHGSGSGSPDAVGRNCFDDGGVLWHGSGSGSPEDSAKNSSVLWHGSGSGSPDKASQGEGVMWHGSGSGSPDQSDQADGVMWHGSGSGSPDAMAGNFEVMWHGSGSGSPEGSGESCFEGGFVAWHGSGSGSPEAKDNGDSVMWHGSGSGSPESVSGSGNVMWHGSGSGSPDTAGQNCSGSASLWGVAEIAIDPAGMSIVIHRLTANGLEEHSVAFRAFEQQGRFSDAGRIGFVKP